MPTSQWPGKSGCFQNTSVNVCRTYVCAAHLPAQGSMLPRSQTEVYLRSSEPCCREDGEAQFPLFSCPWMTVVTSPRVLIMIMANKYFSRPSCFCKVNTVLLQEVAGMAEHLLGPFAHTRGGNHQYYFHGPTSLHDMIEITFFLST